MINRNFLLIIFQVFLLQNASASFQDNLFKEIIDGKKGENVMFSPLSLYQVISLVLNGASGKTREEIFKVLFPDKDLNEQLIKDINSNIEKIVTDLKPEPEDNIGDVKDEFLMAEYYNTDNRVTFNNANALFYREGISFKDKFKEVCTQYNTSYLKLESAEQVNNYVSNHTNGKIKNIIGSIDNIRLFMIINALYFKGSWDQKFYESATKKRAFKNPNGIVMVDTMYQNYEYGLYYEDEKVQMISLPYRSYNIPYKMTIILPNEKIYSSPMDYLNQEKINFHEISSKLNYEKNIHLYLPKFKYESMVDVTSILEKLGMKLAFTDSADFSNLVDGQCFISDSFQKTYINLNENGTEAAAATAFLISGCSLQDQKVEIEHYMYVNHSFIYMIESNEIKDIDNHNIMPFIGIVNYIKEEEDSTSSDDPTHEPEKFLPEN